MRFRVSGESTDGDYELASGIYVHGQLDEKFVYDITEIMSSDIDTFKLLAERESVIDGMKVELDGHDGTALLYAWPSLHGKQMIANPQFSAMMYRGLIADDKDSESVKYAKQCLAERRAIL